MASITLKGRTKNIANRSKKYVEEALYHRLFKQGGDEVSVRHQLNLFLKSKKRVYKWEVGDTIKKLRDRKHYYAALKVVTAECYCCFKSLAFPVGLIVVVMGLPHNSTELLIFRDFIGFMLEPFGFILFNLTVSDPQTTHHLGFPSLQFEALLAYNTLQRLRSGRDYQFCGWGISNMMSRL
ncbi:hypothetical protein KSS87_003119 [Heliosperma pusillum]|nr:hypothetical protein KSS87_003119 [Heliosperma pusillum]